MRPSTQAPAQHAKALPSTDGSGHTIRDRAPKFECPRICRIQGAGQPRSTEPTDWARSALQLLPSVHVRAGRCRRRLGSCSPWGSTGSPPNLHGQHLGSESPDRSRRWTQVRRRNWTEATRGRSAVRAQRRRQCPVRAGRARQGPRFTLWWSRARAPLPKRSAPPPTAAPTADRG